MVRLVRIHTKNTGGNLTMKFTSKLGFAAAMALGFNSFVPAFAAEQTANPTIVNAGMSYYQAAYKDEQSLTSIIEKAFNKNLDEYEIKNTDNGIRYVMDDGLIDVQGIDLNKEGYQVVKMSMKSDLDKLKKNSNDLMSTNKEIVSIKNAVIEVRDEQAPTITAQDQVKTTENQVLDLNSFVSAQDNSGEVEVSFDHSIDFSKAGNYTVNIEAKDANGNVSTDTMEVVVEKDDFYDRIAQAAIAQVGVSQDCTMLVTNALKAVGINFHGWPAEYAQLGSFTDNPVPGDIIIYSGHVALYIGNGQAVHGGWLGNQTVISTVECTNPLVGFVHVAH